MLDSLRAFSRTWVAKIFLGVLVLSFALFGIQNVVTSIGGNTVARVGEEDISAREFQRAYQSQLNAAARQFGFVPTPEQAIAQGIPGAVLSQLATSAAINQLTRQMGLGVSEDRLSKLVREDPSFAGTLGQFERTNFVRVLQQNGFTESEYFKLQERAARRQQLVAGIFADSPVPETAKDLVNRFSGDTRTIDYFVLGETSLLTSFEASEEELVAYLEENQQDYRTPETRTVDVLMLTPAAIAATKTIPQDQIAAEYERTRASLTVPERRTIRQVVLPDAAAVEAFSRGREAGTAFDALLSEAGLTPTELGTLARSDVTDAALADAAFQLAEGAFALIPGVGGQRAVQVIAIEPGGTPPLDEAGPAIAERLALAEARTEFIEVLDQVEELRAAFQSLEQIAERFGLDVTTLDVTAGGAELASLEGLPESERQRVAAAIFAAEPERLPPALTLSANHNLWFDLKTVEPARDQTLDEVRGQIVADWTDEKNEEALQAQTEEIIARLEAGEAFADVAVSVNQFPSLSQPMTRSGDGTEVIDATIGRAAFGGGVGHFGSARNGLGDFVVFQVVDVTSSTEANPMSSGFIDEGTRDSQFNDFVGAVRNQYGVRENRAVLNQLLALDQSGS